MSFGDPKERAALATRAKSNYKRFVREGKIPGPLVEPTDVFFLGPIREKTRIGGYEYRDPKTLLVVHGRKVLAEFFMEEILVRDDIRGRRIDDGKIRLRLQPLRPEEQETRLGELEATGSPFVRA